MTEYYKAVRPDGTDFYSGTIDYLAGGVIRHPNPDLGSTDASHYLSVSTEKADCTGFSWPARLLRVEPVGDVVSPDPRDLPNKRAVGALRVVEELPAHELFGPNGEQVVAFLEWLPTLTRADWLEVGRAWVAAWDAARYAARDVARYAVRVAARVAAWDAARVAARVASRDAARDVARDAAWDVAWYATWDATVVLLVRDRLPADHFKTLVAPFRGLGFDFKTGRRNPND